MRAGGVIWLTGLPAAGKTTLALALERRLCGDGRSVVRLDGDELRRGLCVDLGFSPADRVENIRRAAEVARLVADSGKVCVAALVSPTIADRQRARQIVGAERFLEVYLATPVVVCRARDVKGNYARADRGEIAEFTGVSAPYEAPPNPGVVVYLQPDAVECAVECVLARFDAAAPSLRLS